MAKDHIPPRKYFTEVAIGLFTQGFGVMPADQLHTNAKLRPEQELFYRDCHIYLICRRPFFSFEKASFSFSDRTCSGNLLYRKGGIERTLPFRFEITDSRIDSMKVGEYPHRELLSFDKDGTHYTFFPASMVSLHPHVREMEIRSFEVIYVGQAYGNGSRSALERAKSHSTLQKILAETAARRPDDEIWIFMFDYAPHQLFMSMDGITKSGIIDERDDEHRRRAFSSLLGKKEEIALAEAGLIKYFDPVYNKIYRYKFPHRNQKILDKCYGLDFSGLVVEINTDDLGMPIFSDRVRAGMHHIARFDLHDPAKRRSFFAFVDKDGRYALLDDSGPVW